ncbi:chaplin [Streptomyces sp. NPDC002952]|uniref:chaplin n=1 Tax=Streptomyces sp. NPDC002952 TaxID=3364673 RepID=UPI0036C20419
MRQTLSRGMVVAAAATGILSMYGSPALADSQAGGAASDSPGVGSGNNVAVPVDVPVNACGNSVNVVGALNPAFGNSCANGPRQHGSHGSHGAPHRPAPHGGHGGNHGSGRHGSGHDDEGGYGDAPGSHGPSSGHGHSGSSAHGGTQGSPGVGGGNDAEAPVDVPVNVCGNTADVIGLLNPVFGNVCGEEPGRSGGKPQQPHTPGQPHTPPGVLPDTPSEVPRGPHGAEPITSPVETRALPPVDTSESLVDSTTGSSSALARTGGEDVLSAAAASAALLISGTVLYRRSRTASRR